MKHWKVPPEGNKSAAAEKALKNVAPKYER